MSSVKIILRPDHVNSKNEHPLWLRVTKNRKSKYITLPIYLKEELWDDQKQRVRKSHPTAAQINAFLAKKVSEAEGVSLELQTQNKYIGSYNIKETLMGKVVPDFFPYADIYASSFEAKGKIGSHRRAKAVIEKLRKFVNGRNISFDQVTVSFLNEYEIYMRTEWQNRTNTVHANFRVLRTIINNAVREDLIPADMNPFNKMRLKTEKTERAYLTEEELQKIEELVITESFMLNHHRNIYVFACYAGGLRISDVLQLKWKNLDNGKVHIKIHKTQTPLSFKVPDRALKIIDFYRSENSKSNDFIFPLLKISPDEKSPVAIHNAISSASAYVNKDLRKIAELAKIDKHLSFHTSRHSFSCLAISKEIPMEVLSKILGHSNIRETQIYGRIMNTQIDKAMEVFNKAV